MKLEAPLTIEIDGLNDWKYYAGLGAFQTAIIHLEIGWPVCLIVKVLGLGFRLEVHWSGRS